MTNDCWNLIGVGGDRSCPELATYTHCRNCPIYSTAGRNLLDREAPPGYVQEWTSLLAEAKIDALKQQIAPTNAISIAIFRLEGEWLALPTALFKEVTPPSVIRTLPHRSNAILLGLVNIRGEILTCVSLSALLRLETSPAANRLQTSHVVYQRMVVVEKEGNRWVFPVNEMYGVHRIYPDDLANVPATVSNVPESYTKGLLKLSDRSIIYLDEELLFYTLSKKVL